MHFVVSEIESMKVFHAVFIATLFFVSAGALGLDCTDREIERADVIWPRHLNADFLDELPCTVSLTFDLTRNGKVTDITLPENMNRCQTGFARSTAKALVQTTFSEGEPLSDCRFSVTFPRKQSSDTWEALLQISGGILDVASGVLVNHEGSVSVYDQKSARPVPRRCRSRLTEQDIDRYSELTRSVAKEFEPYSKVVYKGHCMDVPLTSLKVTYNRDSVDIRYYCPPNQLPGAAEVLIEKLVNFLESYITCELE